MDKKDYRYILHWAKKIKAINELGGKCIRCKESNIFKLEFHHKTPTEKESKVSSILDKRWTVIKEEIKKCILLCRNCHKEVHYTNEIKDNKSRENKNICLIHNGSAKCSVCGYTKCLHALDFHHLNETNKDFILSQITIRLHSIGEIPEEIQKEINKCVVVCRNCHILIHTDGNKFTKYKDEIYKAVNMHKELQTKIDRAKVKELFHMCYSKSKIAKELNCAKSTITGIFKIISL